MSNYIKRSIEASVKELEQSFPVIIVTGPRQVGKTTLLNQITKNKKINYVSLDDLDARSLAQEDPEMFLRTYEYPLVIDEFQYAPNLLPYIKILVDKKRLEKIDNSKVQTTGLFYLTGSQAFQTMKNVAESLAGRIGILDLNTLSNREINGLKEDKFIPDLEILKNKKKTKKLSVEELYSKILKGRIP